MESETAPGDHIHHLTQTGHSANHHLVGGGGDKRAKTKCIKRYTKTAERLKNKGGKHMTIYEELIQRVSDGENFHIDFEKLFLYHRKVLFVL